MIQLQGDQRKDVQEFLVDKKEGLELDAKTIKVLLLLCIVMSMVKLIGYIGPWVLDPNDIAPNSNPLQWTDRGAFGKDTSFASSLFYW